MEIKITWNVCRICLEEDKIKNVADGEMQDIFSDKHTARSIFEFTNVRIKPNDSLPQKICRKCLQFLKQAVHFRNSCRNSDSYLQKILQKANYTQSLFKMDKPPSNIEYVDTIEDPNNEVFTEEQSSSSQALHEIVDPTSHKMNTNEQPLILKQNPTDDTSELEPQADTYNLIYENDKSQDQTNDEQLENEEQLISSPNIETNLKLEPQENTTTNQKTKTLDLSEIFLSSDTELEQDELNDVGDNVNYVTFKNPKEKEAPEEEQQVIDYVVEDDNEENNHFLTIKNLEAPLNEEEAEEHAEMLETNSPVNIARNDVNDELFFIYEHDSLPTTKTQNEIINNTTKDEQNENIIEIESNNIIDNENIEMIANNDSMDSHFENEDNDDNDFVKCENINQDSSSNNDYEDMYVYEDDDDIILSPSDFHRKTKFEKDLTESNKNITTYLFSKQIKTVKSTQDNRFLDCQCTICGNQFHTRSLLKYHMRTHKNERNHECEICFKRFTTACNLTTHIRTHTGEKPFSCKYCERRFADKSTLVKHERSHTDERPYSCNLCNKAFSLSSSLKAHERVHTGEKPFSCDPCGKAFKLSHQLKAHLSTNSHRSRIDGEFIIPNEA